MIRSLSMIFLWMQQCLGREKTGIMYGLKKQALERRFPAFPEMDVNGVRRSWEIDLKRLARSCSFFARTAAFSFAAAGREKSRVWEIDTLRFLGWRAIIQCEFLSLLEAI